MAKLTYLSSGGMVSYDPNDRYITKSEQRESARRFQKES